MSSERDEKNIVTINKNSQPNTLVLHLVGIVQRSEFHFGEGKNTVYSVSCALLYKKNNSFYLKNKNKVNNRSLW